MLVLAELFRSKNNGLREVIACRLIVSINTATFSIEVLSSYVMDVVDGKGLCQQMPEASIVVNGFQETS